MSTFKTTIPMDLKAVRGMLPADSDVESIEWNEETKQVELVWSNRNLVTPYSVPVVWSVDELKAGTRPAAVTVRNARPVAAPGPVPTAERKVVGRRGKSVVRSSAS